MTKEYFAPPDCIADFDLLEEAMRNDDTEKMVEIGSRLYEKIMTTTNQSKSRMLDILQYMFLPSKKQWAERKW